MNKQIAIPVSDGLKKHQTGKSRLHRLFIQEKLHNPLGYTLLFIISAIAAIGIATVGPVFGVLMLAGMLAIPIVYTIVVYPNIGMVIFLIAAYSIMFFLRLGVNFPLGTLMDSMEGLFILGLFIQQKRNPDWTMFKTPISTLVLMWMVYNIVEFANPSAESRMAWVYTVRSVAVVMVMYFIFLYNIRTVAMVRFVLKLWLFLATIAAVYAFKQQYIGFFPFEEAYLHSDPNIGLLLFIGGVWRKFSIFSDPVVFAYSMVVASMICVGLMTGPFSGFKKIVLFGLFWLYTIAMLFSGTRGAFVMPVAGFALFAILKYSKTVLIAVIASVGILIVIINIPTGNQTIARFQTAFKPNNDASYTARKINQKRIQPYIWKHPLGGGLGATGEWGQRFAPGSYLASFPPDSGYVRVAVELGWIGLFIFCTLMFTILKTGINNYYFIRDPELKCYAMAMLLVIFAYHVGNFPQEALVQFPSNVYFYLTTSLVVVLRRLDNQQNELQDGLR